MMVTMAAPRSMPRIREEDHRIGLGENGDGALDGSVPPESVSSPLDRINSSPARIGEEFTEHLNSRCRLTLPTSDTHHSVKCEETQGIASIEIRPCICLSKRHV